LISRQRVVKVSQLLSNTIYRGAAQDETWIKEISSIIGCSQIAKKFMVSSIRDAQMAKIGTIGSRSLEKTREFDLSWITLGVDLLKSISIGGDKFTEQLG